jgi:molybdopterin-containing oxidoreductase family iron-sulfur binding subunit
MTRKPPLQNHGRIDRRALLGGIAGLAATLLAPGVWLSAMAPGPAQARAPDQQASVRRRRGLLIDLNKCEAGCDHCVAACRDENGLQPGTRPDADPQWIRKVTLRDPHGGKQQQVPVMCQHCAEPACAAVCPTGASFKRADGIVLVDKHSCIGCRFCMMACPYKARSFVHESVHDQKPYAPRGQGTVESCTLCVHRIDAGRLPACVEACAAKGGGAMLFGDLNDPSSAIAKAVTVHRAAAIRADLGLDPGVRYLGL